MIVLIDLLFLGSEKSKTNILPIYNQKVNVGKIKLFKKIELF